MSTGTGPHASLLDLDWDRLPEFVRLLRESDDVASTLRVWVAQLHELTLKDINDAMERSEMLVEVADRAAPPASRVAARCARSHALAMANRFDDALGLLDQAMDIAHAHKDAHAQAHVDHNAVQPLARLGRLSEAIERAERAVAGFEQAGDVLSTAKAHSNLAVIYRMRDDPRRALHHFDRAIPAMAGMAGIAAQLESNRAEALLDLAEFVRAEESFTRAMSAFHEAGALHAAAVVEGNLADLLGRQGRLDAALRHFEHARGRFEGSGAPGDAARLEAERAEVLATIGLSSEARDAWREVIPALERAGLVREAARARVGLASRLLRDGRLDEAESVARRGAEQCTIVGAELILARANRVLAGVATRKGRLEDARSMLRDAIEALGDAPAEQAATIADAAALALESGELGECLEQIERGCGVADRLGLPVLRATFLHLRGRLHDKSGIRDEARRAYGRAIDQIERMRGVFTGEHSRAAWLGDHTGVYLDLARLELDQDSADAADRAFNTIERSRSRALLDMVHGGVELTEHIAHAAESDQESEYLKRLAAKRSELNAFFSWIESDSARGRHAREAAGDRLATLEREIASLEGRLAATRRFTEVFGDPVTADRLRSRLAPGTALIAYFELDGWISAFITTSERTLVNRRLCESARVAQSLLRLGFQIDRAISLAAAGKDACEPRHVGHTDRELSALAGMLVEPLMKELLDCKRLVFVASDSMQGVPFAALRPASGYLIESHDVSVSPSASLYEAIVSDGTSAASREALVLGVSDEIAPRIAEEAARVGSVIDGATVAVEDAATSELLSSRALRSGIIHLCCHGVFPPGQPMQARIRLADGWFSARDAYALRLSGSAVVLSCCEGGRGAVGSGGEVLGLARAFLAAGARSIVAGQWMAHDEATLALFEAFYAKAMDTRTKSGNFSAAACLSWAQRSILNRWPHPAFWANFFCVGAS
ncbi:MAG: CHAT domain-containing protein [Phycisphaerales bacterium]|nr:CHAT domain-containing protein [Phycisphaerales bacterium]